MNWRNVFSVQCDLSGSCLADGITANPEKVHKVKNCPVTKDTKELHSFLGQVSYYCQFIHDFAHVAGCLHQLIGLANVKKTKGKKKEVTTLKLYEQGKNPIILMSKHQTAFIALTAALSKVAVLSIWILHKYLF